MSWVLFSTLAALIWAVVNIVEKYILTKWVKEPIVPVIILGTVGLLTSFLIYLFHGFAKLSFFNIGLSFIAGIFYILAIAFYFKAVKIEEISRVVPLFYLTPLFILVFAWIFLEEIFTPIKYLGIFLLVAGAIFISSRNFIKLSFGKAFWFMVFASLILSLNAVITKYLLNFADFWTIFSYTRIGAALGLIPVFFTFPGIISALRKYRKKVIGTMFLNESLNTGSVLLITIATAVGPVTLVNALSSIQLLFVLLFSVILSIFYPEILKEEVRKLTILLKLLAIILMIAGAILIT